MSAAVVQLDDHAAEAALGFPLFKAGEDRLGWLFNMNTVQPLPTSRVTAAWDSEWQYQRLNCRGCGVTLLSCAVEAHALRTAC